MSVSVLDKARQFIVLDHPFFASIILRHPMTPNPATETISVSVKGQISYNPTWVETLPLPQAIFALAHEVLHYASMHGMRQGTREFKEWNEACDQWINETLVASKVGEPMDGCVRSAGAELSTPEKLYDIIMQRPKQDGGGGGEGGGAGQPPPPGGGQPPPPGQGQPKPDPLGNDIEPPPPGMTQGEQAEQENNTKLEVAEAGQAAKMQGKLPGILQQFVADTVESKVPWFDVLERFMTEKIMNDYSWARPNRRYMPDFYMPTLNGIGAMGEIVVQVDISGSASDEEIQHYNGHMKRIIELCNPTKVHVIYTDTQVQIHEEFGPDEEVNINFHRGGGTCMEAGFKYIEAKGIEPVCMVTLTDAFDTYHAENAPTYPVVWCVSTDADAPPYGETVRFTLHD